ncbi:uncharacterized protein LOC114378691 [Glycine soja]|uniref:uncharacterized protein LOC114378691 n=1 Tax=Glycine soja TaxID=3848 RepID=UPI00103FFD10|nr:uncharacterized protein LOC114378691 [Glycine soja]
MTMILDLLNDAFEKAKFPPSIYEAKKIINKLGLNYKNIDACPKHCMLYLGDDEKSLDACKHCGTSRWKPNKKKKIAAKVLRYFPLKPRLQRLFTCRKTAKDMRWHVLEDNKDGLLRHPRDGEAWKTFDLIHPEFSSDPRNVRLGLATDGFNPARTLSSTYSIWPIFLIPYNLPPWICMNHTSFILSMIIPGKQSPGNNIDVYLKPLVEELCELWSGVDTYDSSLNENFRMRAALMWTISDFPGLGILSGWNIHTGLACPTCNLDAEPCRLRNCNKWCFMGHRRFLSRNHKFRLNRVRFDGSIEERNPPLKLSGSEIFRQVEHINTTFGTRAIQNGTRKRSRQEVTQWNKRSIFFELPYWESNLLRHNLDFMHIEKNVCDNVMYTLLHEKDKSKDNLNARKDLKEMGLRPDLWPDDNGKYHLALFSLTRGTKKLFLKTLKTITVPDGYSKLQLLKDRIVVTLCHLEMLFPPSFFTVMVHLTVHLIEEAKLGGPVHYRYMYPVERELGHLKSFVRNKAQPEGSIAEGYLAEESLTFCSRVDGNLRQADLPYYGKLEDIIEINYYGRFSVILFKCKWADTTRDRGYKKDCWNFNCVDFDRLIHIGDREEHEPYIEASQAQMVYYVDDVVNEGWSVVVHIKPIDLYDMGEEVEENAYENESYQEQQLEQFSRLDDQYVQLATNHLNDDIVD